jgi:hypothetical protein
MPATPAINGQKRFDQMSKILAPAKIKIVEETATEH